MLLALLNEKLRIEKELMESFGKQIREFRRDYGNEECDYLKYRREMEIYHRGRVNLLIELIKECD